MLVAMPLIDPCMPARIPPCFPLCSRHASSHASNDAPANARHAKKHGTQHEWMFRCMFRCMFQAVVEITIPAVANKWLHQGLQPQQRGANSFFGFHPFLTGPNPRFVVFRRAHALKSCASEPTDAKNSFWRFKAKPSPV